MWRPVLGLCVLLVASGCSDAASDPGLRHPFNLDVAQGTDPEDFQVIHRAASALAKACPRLSEYDDDIKRIRAEIVPSIGFYSEELGWTRQVNLAVELARSTRTIPAEYRASGHVCHFEFGGGGTPSMRVAKRPCKSICQLGDPDDGHAASVSLPELAVIR